MADLTCACCGATPEKTRDVWHEGDWAPACSPPCEESLRPKPVARAEKACASCGRDVTNEDTYTGGIAWCCLSDMERELVAGDPAVRALRSL